MKARPNWTALGYSQAESDAINDDLDRQKAREEFRVWRKTAERQCRKEAVLPLDQLRGLPDADEFCPGAGVYFMWAGPQLVYIGQSNSVGARISSHRKPASRTTWVESDSYAHRKALEAAYVRRYRPPLNRTTHG